MTSQDYDDSYLDRIDLDEKVQDLRFWLTNLVDIVDEYVKKKSNICDTKESYEALVNIYKDAKEYLDEN